MRVETGRAVRALIRLIARGVAAALLAAGIIVPAYGYVHTLGNVAYRAATNFDPFGTVSIDGIATFTEAASIACII